MAALLPCSGGIPDKVEQQVVCLTYGPFRLKKAPACKQKQGLEGWSVLGERLSKLTQNATFGARNVGL